MGYRGLDPYYEWLGIQPAEQPVDFYRLLGIVRFEENADVIARAADRQMGYVRQFQAKYPAEVSQLLSALSFARITLSDREKKYFYDHSLKNGQAPARSDEPSTRVEAARAVWYVQLFGIPQGPITIDELQARIKAKSVGKDTLVRQGDRGGWMLAKEVHGLFDLPTASPPAPGTGEPTFARLEPLGQGPELLSGPLPEPEDRTPGPHVWVCPNCRWLVPKRKHHCPRCGYIMRVIQARSTEDCQAWFLVLVIVAFVALVLAGAIIQ